MCGESERRGRDLSAADLRSLFDACTRPPRNARGQDSAARRRRDAAFLALTYGCGLRRSEAVAVDVADLDLVRGELRVRRGKGKKPCQVTMPPSTVPVGTVPYMLCVIWSTWFDPGGVHGRVDMTAFGYRWPRRSVESPDGSCRRRSRRHNVPIGRTPCP